MPAIRVDAENDVFLLYGYGDRDKNIIYVQLDHNNRIHWTKEKAVASEFSKSEAERIMREATEKGMRVYSTRVM